MATLHWAVDPSIGSDALTAGFATQALAEASPFATLDRINALVTSGNQNNVWLVRGVGIPAPSSAWAVGTGASLQYFGAYGSGGANAIVDGQATRRAFQFTGKSLITLEDIDATNCASGLGAFYFLGNATRGPDGCILRRCRAYDCDNYGAKFGDAGLTAAYDVLVEDCEFWDLEYGGVDFSGNHDGSIVRRVIVSGANRSNLQVVWGIHAQPTIDKPAGSRVGGAGTFVYTFTLGASLTATKVSYSNSALGYYFFTKNPGGFAALSVGEWDQSGTAVRVNVGADLGATFPTDAMRIAYGDCKNLVIEDCEVYETVGSDGTGMGLDHMVTLSTIRRGISNRNATSGYQINNCETGNVLDTCIAEDNGEYGVVVNKGDQRVTRSVQKIVNCSLGRNTLGGMRINDVGTAALCGSDVDIDGVLVYGSTTALAVLGASASWTAESGVRYHGASAVGFGVATEIAGSLPISSVSGLPVPVSAVGGGGTNVLTTDWRGVPRAGRATAGAFVYIPPQTTTRALF